MFAELAELRHLRPMAPVAEPLSRVASHTFVNGVVLACDGQHMERLVCASVLTEKHMLHVPRAVGFAFVFNNDPSSYEILQGNAEHIK